LLIFCYAYSEADTDIKFMILGAAAAMLFDDIHERYNMPATGINKWHMG